jgi:deoxyribose-phosphate aldolase
MSVSKLSPDVALARRLLPLIDLTSLNESDDAAAIQALARAARTPQGDVAAVCTWPGLIAVAAEALKETGVGLAAVANFPSGEASLGETVAEISAAVAAGADEIDVVIPYRRLLEGDRAAALRTVEVSREACGETVLLKVILETGRLATADNIRLASDLAIEGGADFLKTSTGKIQPGATREAAEVMISAIAAAGRRARPLGFKASGGVRTLAQAGAYLQLFEQILGAGTAIPRTFRVGASALLSEVHAELA